MECGHSELIIGDAGCGLSQSVGQHSEMSERTNSRSASEKRAKAMAAAVRLGFVRKEAEMMKKMAAMEESQKMAQVQLAAEMNVLRAEKEAAAADAEASYLEQEVGINMSLGLPNLDPADKSRQYVASLPASNSNSGTLQPQHSDLSEVEIIQPVGALSNQTSNATINSTSSATNGAVIPRSNQGLVMDTDNDKHPIPPARPVYNSDTDTLTSFLLRKEVMPKRLQIFNEKPQSFPLWKTTFRSVMEEMRVKPVVEIDLLVNHLGNESRVWAESLRASSAANPERGLSLIWERLEHYYGSAEKIEASLKARVANFPQMSNKDNKKLYELSDLLLEIESVKADPKFAASFSVYDSSTGVNTVACKLPYGIQQKWVNHAAKYKKENSVTFPPFPVFVNFVRDMR